MEIRNSLEWPKIEAELMASIRYIDSPVLFHDAHRMLQNFIPMVTQLSKYELEARRSASHSPRRVNEQLELINNSIAEFEKWVTMILLM